MSEVIWEIRGVWYGLWPLSYFCLFWNTTNYVGEGWISIIFYFGTLCLPTLLLLRLFRFSCIEVHFMSKKAANQCLLCHFLVKFYLEKNLTHQMSMLANNFSTNIFKRYMNVLLVKVLLKRRKRNLYLIPGEIWTSQQPKKWSILKYKWTISFRFSQFSASMLFQHT